MRELQRVAAGLSGREALERGVGLTLGGSSSRVLFAVLELARLEQLGCDSLQKECVLLGLPPECLDWYGANFLVRRLKQLALWKESVGNRNPVLEKKWTSAWVALQKPSPFSRNNLLCGSAHCAGHGKRFALAALASISRFHLVGSV